MLARHSWLIPYCNNDPRTRKPPLAYWGAMVSWKVAGRIDVWLARLPAALLGAIAVLLVMDLGRRILGSLGGVISGLVWISTWFIVDEYRKAMADPYLAFFTLLSVWAWLVADEAAHRSRTAESAEQAPWLNSWAPNVFYLLCYASAGFGALAKGHLILIHLLCALVPYQLLKRRSPGRPLVHVAGVILMLLIGLPWFAYMMVNVPGAAQTWTTDAGASHATTGTKFSPVYHYVINLPLTSAPWSVFLIVALLMLLFCRRRRERRHLWPAIWLIVTIIVFSIVPMKKNAYLDPVMPAQTFVVAAGIIAVIDPRKRLHPRSDRWLAWGHAIASGAGVCVVLYLVLSLKQFGIARPLALVSAIGAGILIIGCARFMRPKLLSIRTFAWIAVGFALAISGVEGWLTPNYDNRRSDAHFAQVAASDAAHDALPLIVIGPGLREDVLFYLGRTADVVPELNQLPRGFDGYAIVTQEQQPAVSASPHAALVLEASNRPDKDKLYLFRFR
jgi:4-amino-4-deoxy-L-arabinose transferase-like glycosyltransferase